MKNVRTYWWTGRANFGDALAPLLLARFARVNPEWSDLATADLVTVGSVLEGARNKVVLGSGKLFEETVPDATNRYLAVRGPLTASRIPHPVIPLGDPGLLAPELVVVDRRTHQLGVLPHWSDTTLATDARFTKYGPLVIDPGGDPLDVVRAIGSCHKLVSSSLHGLIVADSFGIPRRLERAPRLLNHEGGMFKFDDYNRSVGVETKIGVTQRASLQAVETLQHVLFDLYDDLEEYL